MLTKICGLKSLEPAQTAISSGAHLLGAIMVPGRARTVDMETAKAISNKVREIRAQKGTKSVPELKQELLRTSLSPADYYTHVARLLEENGPFFVGVFRNQSVEEVAHVASELNLDFVQLHGSEDKEAYAAKLEHYGLILRYVVPQDVEEMPAQLERLAQSKRVVLPLLDSEAGGEGHVIDWSVVDSLSFGRFVLAGGLTAGNLAQAAQVKNVIGFDVSGGVETNGEKDLDKVRKFVEGAKSIKPR